jgi:hypothetical protein
LIQNGIWKAIIPPSKRIISHSNNSPHYCPYFFPVALPRTSKNKIHKTFGLNILKNTKKLTIKNVSANIKEIKKRLAIFFRLFEKVNYICIIIYYVKLPTPGKIYS